MRFQVGDTVYHVSKDACGVITALVGGEEKRYHVQHSRDTWSVPEKYLVKVYPKSKLKKHQ